MKKTLIAAAIMVASMAVMAATFTSGMTEAQVKDAVAAAKKNNESLDSIAKAAFDAGISASYIGNSLISSGVDAGSVTTSLVRAGYEANLVITIATAAGGEPGAMVAAALAGGAKLANITTPNQGGSFGQTRNATFGNGSRSSATPS